MQTEKQIKNRPVLLVLGAIPTGSEIGIDCKIWKIAENFKGFAAIPAGIHYLHYTVANNSNMNDISQLRTGFFFNIKIGDVLIYFWDVKTESLILLEDTEEIERYKRGIYNGVFENNLGAYPVEENKKWPLLSNYLTAEVINRIEPVHKQVVSSSKPLDSNEKEILESMTTTGNDDNIYDNNKANGTNTTNNNKFVSDTSSHIFFTTLPNRFLLAGKRKTKQSNDSESVTNKNLLSTTPQDITSYTFDRSDALSTLLTKEYDNDYNSFLGELQFAFICFLIGQSFDAFDQWKGMVHLVCLSEKALLGNNNYNTNITTDFFVSFLKIFKLHLKEIPLDFFYSDLSKGNFIEECVKNLYLICITEENATRLENKQTITCYDKNNKTEEDLSGINSSITANVTTCHPFIKIEVYSLLKFLKETVGLDVEHRYNTKSKIIENKLDDEDLPVIVDLNATMF
jgi:A1 cistron-splicing factor AAR2